MAEPSESPEWTESITLQCKTVLDLPPSCLEFVPKPSEAANASPHLKEYYHEYFVVGTYYLEKEESTQLDSGDVEQEEEEKSTTASKLQSKNGSLVLFRYHDGNLRIVQTLPYPSAVFDLHFIPGLLVFVIVSNTGTVAIFKLTEKQHDQEPSLAESDVLHIEAVSIFQVFPKDVAPTYFTWAPDSQHAIAVTASDGGVYLVRLGLNYDGFQILNNEKPVIMHSEYAWCSSFSSTGDHLYSGGDDNKLRLENLGNVLSVLNSEELEPSELFPKGIPGHEAGVTFILPLPVPTSHGQPEILLTGSYDDHIRILSIPAYPSRPNVLTELHLGGGVWRIKIIDSTTSDSRAALRYTVLASCMHAGARILLITGARNSSDEAAESTWEISVLAEMKLHKSMNYASDVEPIEREGNGGEKRVFVSSSFYDRLLCVWTWDSTDGA